MSTPLNIQPEIRFLGLAPFLRMSIASINFLPLTREILAKLEQDTENAKLWMNLSIALLCLGQRDAGLAIQAQALAMTRTYQLTAARQPAKLQLLMLMVEGDLAGNTPLDCLLEDCDIDLIFHYVTPDMPLSGSVPEHDALIVTIGISDQNQALLTFLESQLRHWPKPVINAPQYIPGTDRNQASVLLADVPGLLIPPTLRASRETLLHIAAGNATLPSQFKACEFPIILRPLASQAGHDLDKIERAGDLAAYLARVKDTEFFLSRFIDYRNDDGLFRKVRVVLINGRAYACHMAVSSNWMVHYVNADMYEDAAKRAEEATFMANFDGFVDRHRSALEAIYQRTLLDYLCIDCAETRDGQLLVFEIDHAMVVHAMDPEDLFPYKRQHMQKVKYAFRDFLLRLTEGNQTVLE